MKIIVAALLTLSTLLGACQLIAPPPAATPLPPAPSAPPTTTLTPPATIPPTATPLPQPAQGGTAVDSINLTPIVRPGKLDHPLYLTDAGDERLFVAGKRGKIYIIADGRVLPEPFLDIGSRVNALINEQGLLGLAFHPQYRENGRFFIYYTTLDNSDTVLAEYRVSDNPNKADPDSEQIMLYVDQPDSVHNGGQLAFGPDGYLYLGLGDGGLLYDRTGNAQNLENILGSILRLDVDGGQPYAIPPDNPFAHEPEARPEVWAYGLRNPWRFSFDRLTGDMFISDVGEFGWEEINWQAAGSAGSENHGWNVWEGTDCFEAEDCPEEGFVFPAYAYDHTEGCAIIGGYVYRGQQFPELRDNYFFGDYCTGKIWRLFPAGADGWKAAPVYQGDFLITSFGEDAAGELYVLTQHGDVWQIRP
ncbi:MAG: PQQ-dependent sugar dehydrogenase [Chloroflexi bacterium]|nr:PQQ-dependent sugar dehydrogenase [Chloroflexota bacterium]